MGDHVTREQAEAVLAAVKAQYKGYLDAGTNPPNLRGHEHENLAPGCWSIDWEEGPFEWAIHALETHVDEEIYEEAKAFGMDPERARTVATTPGPGGQSVPGVFIEALTHYSIGLYPSD